MPDTSIEETTTDVTAVSEYVPRRLWWFKRIGICTLLLFAGLIAAHFVVLHSTEAKLHNLIEQCREAGEPVYPKDYNAIPPVPNEVNSALLYEKASLAFTWPASIDPNIKLDDFMDPSFIETHMDEARKIIIANKATFDAIREAGTLPEAHWQQGPFTSPLSSMSFPNLGGNRQLVKLLYLSALFESKNGRHAKAMDNINEILLLSERLRKLKGGIIVHMVASSCCAKAINAISIITPSCHFTDKPIPRNDISKVVSLKDAVLLINKLLNDTPIKESWASAINFERATIIDAGDLICSGSPISPISYPKTGILFKPHWRLEQYDLTTELTTLASIPASADFHSAQKQLPDRSLSSNLQAILTKPISSSFLLPGIERPVELHYRLIAERRMAAIAIAIRIYESQNGRRPQNLSELVPDYLPAVPVDPFSSTGDPLGYLPNADRPRLYSVNLDGFDDGGTYAVEKKFGYRDELDLPFFLDGKPREKVEK